MSKIAVNPNSAPTQVKNPLDDNQENKNGNYGGISAAVIKEIFSIDINVPPGPPSPSTEAQIQFINLICELKRAIDSGESTSDINNIIAQIQLMLNDPTISKELDSSQVTLTSMAKNLIAAYKSGKDPASAKTAFDQAFNDTKNNQGAVTTIADWLNDNSTAIEQILNDMSGGFVQDGMFKKQAILDLGQLALIMLTLTTVTNSQYGQGLDQLFFGDANAIFQGGMMAEALMYYSYEVTGSWSAAKTYYESLLKSLPAGSSSTPNYNAILKDMQNTPFPSGGVDAADAFYALQQIRAALAEFEGSGNS